MAGRIPAISVQSSVGREMRTVNGTPTVVFDFRPNTDPQLIMIFRRPHKPRCSTSFRREIKKNTVQISVLSNRDLYRGFLNQNLFVKKRPTSKSFGAAPLGPKLGTTKLVVWAGIKKSGPAIPMSIFHNRPKMKYIAAAHLMAME